MPPHRYDPRPALRGQLHQHQPDGPGAEHRHPRSRLDRAGLDPAHDAGQRLGQGGAVKRHARDAQHVLGDDARGQAGELRVGAVPEEQVVAQARPLPPAGAALAAGRGVGGHHRVAPPPPVDPGADLLDDARHLVAEERRRHDHPRVIAAAEDLGVGAAGERGLDADQDLARPRARHRHVLDAEVALSVEDGRAHHHRLSSPAGRPSERRARARPRARPRPPPAPAGSGG